MCAMDGGHWLGDGPGFAKELAAGVSANGALASLNISSNNLGELVMPEGWTKGEHVMGRWAEGYWHTDGRTP